mgnify:CR=1 FL=1
MARSNSHDRLRRLELLAAHLKQEGFCTIKELAVSYDVSERTSARDLQLMRDQGLPIDADRGRGGGVRLDRHWGIGRLNLSYPEAVDLLISISVAEQMKSPIFLANLASIRRQLIASFSAEKRERVDRLGDEALDYLGQLIGEGCFVHNDVNSVCEFTLAAEHAVKIFGCRYFSDTSEGC